MRFTSGVSPAILLVANMAAEPISSCKQVLGLKTWTSHAADEHSTDLAMLAGLQLG